MSQTEKKQSSSPFISGIALGSLLGSAALYFFGTKKGRNYVHKLLEVCENIENIVDEHEKSSKARKNSDNPIVSDVENLMSKLQSILPSSNKE